MIVSRSFVSVLRVLAPRLTEPGMPVHVGDTVRCVCRQYCEGMDVGMVIGIASDRGAIPNLAVVLWNRDDVHP